jgi:quercetin dioxygenase-like cupin family protein
MSRLFHGPNLHVGCMRLPPGGLVGLHQASGPQLLAIVEGEGWIRGKDAARTAISAGDAVFWEAGEWHETGSESGMVALVIESASLSLGDQLGPIAKG